MNKYDVVIIGAGPGGLQCAKDLSETGLTVLLLERKAEIGPKVCAGGISGNDIDILGIKRKDLGQSFKSVELVSGGKTVSLDIGEDYLFTIGRHELGQWQLKQLTDKNITVRISTRVMKVEQNSVTLDTGEQIQFKYLVGADGATSMVRRFLKLDVGQGFATYQYRVPKVYDKLEFHFESDYFHSGYAWIFPHKDGSLIGCGADPRFFSPKKLKEGFFKWAKEQNIDLQDATYESFPIRVDYQGWNFGNIFLLGEAAGLVSALTAEGIYMALASGRGVARKISDPNYDDRDMIDVIAKWRRHKKVADIFIKSGAFRQRVFGFMLWLFSRKRMQQKIVKRYIPQTNID